MNVLCGAEQGTYMDSLAVRYHGAKFYMEIDHAKDLRGKATHMSCIIADSVAYLHLLDSWSICKIITGSAPHMP